jgi:hypothetical protein
MLSTITGTVVSVTNPKVFSAKDNRSRKAMPKDYYHVIIDVPDKKKHDTMDMASRLEEMRLAWSGTQSSQSKHRTRKAKVYFPVVENVSNRSRSAYDKKAFTFVQNEKNGEWIPYNLFNPSKIVGFNVEVTGDVQETNEGNYYINKVSEFKIHSK